MDQSKQFIGELERQWNELAVSWKAGKTKEVTARFEEILAVQKQLTGILETVTDELNHLIDLPEKVVKLSMVAPQSKLYGWVCPSIETMAA